MLRSMEVRSSPFSISDISLSEGDVAVKLLFVSLDPYMRGRMRVNADSYVASFQLNEPMTGGCVGEIIKSENADFPIGAVVTGSMSWETITIVKKAKGLLKINTSLGVPLSYCGYFFFHFSHLDYNALFLQ
jgi:NADPH-dependent curcumin reductase CurA